MKKLSFLFFPGMLSVLFFSGKTLARQNPFIVFEYMHVKPGNDNAYMQVENFRRQIHIARAKKGNIPGWFVRRVEASNKTEAPYQYVALKAAKFIEETH